MGFKQSEAYRKANALQEAKGHKHLHIGHKRAQAANDAGDDQTEAEHRVAAHAEFVGIFMLFKSQTCPKAAAAQWSQG